MDKIVSPLAAAVRAWDSAEFNVKVKQALESLGAHELQLQSALTQGNYVNTDSISIMIIAAEKSGQELRITVGVFFTSLLTGCSCADDPTPDPEFNEYCELKVSIDTDTLQLCIEPVE